MISIDRFDKVQHQNVKAFKLDTTGVTQGGINSLGKVEKISAYSKLGETGV